jgi:hypothetical protein
LAIKENLLYLSVSSDPWYWLGSGLKSDIADPSHPQDQWTYVAVGKWRWRAQCYTASVPKASVSSM